jgi:hypothetical protein
MPAFTLNDSPIASGYLSLPLRGRPVGGFIVAEPWEGRRLQDGRATLRMELDDQVSAWQGTVRLSPHPDGWTVARFVGGADGLEKLLKPRYYESIPYRTVLADAIREAGERPGKLEVEGVAAQYVRRTMPLADLLELLTPEGKVWRINEEGEVEVTAPAWAASGSAYAVEEVDHGAWGVVMDLTLRPGTTLELYLGGAKSQVRVERVVHRINPRRLVTEVWRA